MENSLCQSSPTHLYRSITESTIGSLKKGKVYAFWFQCIKKTVGTLLSILIHQYGKLHAWQNHDILPQARCDR